MSGSSTAADRQPLSGYRPDQLAGPFVEQQTRRRPANARVSDRGTGGAPAVRQKSGALTLLNSGAER